MSYCCFKLFTFGLKKNSFKYLSWSSGHLNYLHLADNHVNTLLISKDPRQLCNSLSNHNSNNISSLVDRSYSNHSIKSRNLAQSNRHINLGTRIGFTSSNRSIDLGYQQIRLLSTMNNNSITDPRFTSDTDEPVEQERRLREKYAPREITFKTSFGHLACLEWGNRDAPRKVFCMHGWLDNAGSFERLIPFILNHNDNDQLYHFVAMDMPGVGHSSHRPHGADYTTFSNIIEMRRVTTQLGWHQNLTLLSHSLGAHFSFLYSCIYPKQVKNFISIDVARPITFHADNWNITLGNAIENYFRNEYQHCDDPKTEAVIPVYTESQALKRLMEAHSNSLSFESARTLMKRGASKTSTGYIFNRDIRHRGLSVEFRPDEELMLKYLDRAYSANLFIIRSTRSPFRMPEEMRQKYYGIYQRNCKVFREILTDGTHHVHMNNPDVIGSEINKFLEEVGQLATDDKSSQVNSTSINGMVSQAGRDNEVTSETSSGAGVKLEGSAEAPRPKSKL